MEGWPPLLRGILDPPLVLKEMRCQDKYKKTKLKLKPKNANLPTLYDYLKTRLNNTQLI